MNAPRLSVNSENLLSERTRDDARKRCLVAARIASPCLPPRRTLVQSIRHLGSRLVVVIAVATGAGVCCPPHGAFAAHRIAATMAATMAADFADSAADGFSDAGGPDSFPRDRYAIPVRHRRLMSDSDKSAEEGRSFAARLKHKQGRNLTRKKRRFRQQQAWLERQRRVMRQKRAAARAHQYAAARRHAGKRHRKAPRRIRRLK